MKTKNAATAAVILLLTFNLFAKDFQLENLPQAQNPSYDLTTIAGSKSYYDFMHETVGPHLVVLANEEKGFSPNEVVLRNGGGLSVKLSERNYNVHINFPNQATGGRSYGWTAGQVGDWSDAMYLDNLQRLVTSKDKQDLSNFYTSVVKMLGACDSRDIETLSNQGQRVAANFLAIYTAEEFRAMVPEPFKNWDDALFEVTMLGAFHGGQSTLTKYYLGRFGAQAKAQGSGVYAKFHPGPMADQAQDKDRAELNDYWQFSANPESKQSGINITRNDFEKMGETITKYEDRVAHNSNLAKVQSVVGKSRNVIKSISRFFTNGKSHNPAEAETLAADVANLMMDIYDDADKITAWEQNGEK